MGNAMTRRQREEGGDGERVDPPPPPPPVHAPNPPRVYAQYPSPTAQYHDRTQTYVHQFPPMSNGQYYGGWGAYTPPYPTHQQYQHQPRPYPQQAAQQAAPQAVPPRPLPPTQQLTQTATIRNAVNLKKASLAISRLQEDMSKLTISFSFDASAPCAVSTFLFATEDVSKGCALTSKFSPQPAPVVLFDKGLGLKFPAGAPEGESASAAMQHVVDMSSLQRWTSSSEVEEETEVFPLVIRLEVINERGLKNGKTLKEIVPGGEQKDWVQSQTTYATIKHEDDGGWTIKVLKQKIWVEGVSYELQEIYGLEHAAESKGNASSGDNAGGTGTTDRSDDAEERLCVICLVNPRDTTVLPCRHMCLCSECAGELRKQTSKCPICRNNIESLLHIKISKEGRKQAQAQSSSQGQS